jgi:membrane protease YdiL (CAAX protease family)
LNFPQVWKDRQYGAAIAAAPFFWGILLLLGYAPSGLSYPLEEPQTYLRFALIYPVLEELVFRGLIQENLHRVSWGKRQIAKVSAANIATSVLFAASHLIFHSPLRAAGVFFPSLVFGYFRDRYGRIVPSIVLHVFYNAGFMLFFPG